MELKNKNKKMYQDLETYTFTVNPSDRYQYFNKIDRFRKAYRSARSYLANICYAEYDLYPEISKTGRIHWHGYITMLNAASFQLYDVPMMSKYSIYEIDFLTDPLVWHDYIEKDKTQMKKLTDHLIIMYKITNKLKSGEECTILEALNKFGASADDGLNAEDVDPLER